jgi:hypothetical protein
VRLGLARYLSKIPHVDATKALARLVLFSAEDEIRVAAIEALELRREKDYTPNLMQGFRYPLPQVAQRASEALVRLKYTDAVPQLVDLLEESDPRLPVTTETQGKKVALLKEVVRVNHHRNCMLCHSPAPIDGNNDANKAVPVGPRNNLLAPPLTARVPLPNQPLPSLSNRYYGLGSTPNIRPDISISVRFDVTYLRQDFSLMMPVPDAAPWPEMQRFDFMVRSRVLSAQEAEEYQQQASKAVAGSATPYQDAVLFALRQLTQLDAGPTAQAWRELLLLPAKTSP